MDPLEAKLLPRVCLTASALTCWSLAAAPLPVEALAAPAEENQEQVVRDALDSAAELLGQGHARQALSALQPAGKIEPHNPWLLFYQGAAHLQLGAAYEAMADLDRALDLLAGFDDPEPELARQIELLRCTARRQVLKVTYQTGLAFDTNVTFMGDAATGLDLIAGREDGKFSSGLGIHYSPLATERHALTLGARLGHSWHFSVEEFDYQDYGAYLRYARRLNDRFSADIQYDYDISYLGNELFLSNHAITPGVEYRWREGPGQFDLDRTRLYYQFAGRDFLFDTMPEFDRDGLAHAVGIEQSMLLQPVAGKDWIWRLAAGYQFASIGTQGTEFDRFTHDFYLGLNLPLVNPMAPDRYLILPDKELLFTFNANWQLADYREGSLLDAERDERSDLTTTFGFALSQKLIEDTRCGDLTLHAIINWTDADSNVTTARDLRFPYLRSTPFTYDKVVYGVQLEWSW